jgi:hypothetical protein
MRRAILIGLVSVVIVAAPFILAYLTSRMGFAAPKTTDLTKLQEKALETVVEMGRLLTTLATALFAGASAYGSTRYRGVPIPSSQLVLIAASCSFAASSIISGYFAYDTMVWMLMNNFFAPTLPALSYRLDAQFWFFALSVAAVAIFAYRELEHTS